MKHRGNALRIPLDEMKNTFERILSVNGFPRDRAEACANLFATNSLEGVYSHGVNRFAHFVHQVHSGVIDPNARPSPTLENGALEQWNGNSGPGPLNALEATDRAMVLAEKYGVGCIALANTNHWMRAGHYGWKAAKAGYVFIGWTNTIPLMPAWGAVDSHLGNNPIVFAVPYPHECGSTGTDRNGAIVLDMAMSQFSYGKMIMHKLTGEPLPVFGGHDKDGTLTTNAADILESRRALPMGFWKGAALSLLLDLSASILTGGLSTHQLADLSQEAQVSQVYIAFDLTRLSNHSSLGETVAAIIRDYKNSTPEMERGEIVYPGERVEHVVRENMKHGIPVDESIWEEIRLLADSSGP